MLPATVNDPFLHLLRCGVCVLLVAACQAPAPTPPAASDEESVALPAASGPIERCFALDPDASEIRILAYKAGPLARLGHNHVLSGNGLGARLALGSGSELRGLRLRFAVASLVVDPPAARLEEGPDFHSEVSARARQDTHTNLLGPRVLDAQQHPYIDVELAGASGPLWAPDVALRVHLRGAAFALPVTVAAHADGDRLAVASVFTVRQTALGLEPFDVLGGGLQVADELKVRARLTFRATETRDLASCLVEFADLTATP